MPSSAGLVVAAGRSSRLGGSVAKQFLDLGGRTVVGRSAAALASCPGLDAVLVVLPAESIGGAEDAALRTIPGILPSVAGGATRAASVANGLAALEGYDHVLVHDGARPFATPALCLRVLEATRREGAAVPAVPVPDTVKEADGGGFVLRTVDRRSLRCAQTPQGSRRDWLVEALDAAFRAGREPTDEAQALEEAGRKVALVEGEAGNAKITTARDVEQARRRLFGGIMRVGTGFDVHRFGAGRDLVLGGIPFPGETGLAGHSDADVVLHAAMDAVLGAAGLEDIGALFPPDDPRYAGADSRGLAAEVARRVAHAGFEIVNLDLTLLAERPRIRSRVAEMRASIAAAFGIDAEGVGVKATTLEGLGALGRGEGIACQAAASVRRKEPAP